MGGRHVADSYTPDVVLKKMLGIEEAEAYFRSAGGELHFTSSVLFSINNLTSHIHYRAKVE
jgi:hypothetical protein